MNAEQAQSQSPRTSQAKSLAVVRAMMGVTGGREDDDHPMPPGPWDPVIRLALERSVASGPSPLPWRVSGRGQQHWWSSMESLYGPAPDPWKGIFAIIAARYPVIWEVIGGGPGFGAEVELNPQPLPPLPERFTFLASLAQTVISRAELFQEIADATRREGEQQGIIIVSGYVSRFADYICGNDPRLRWPFPGPRPHWFIHEIDAIDLMVMAVHFEQAAKATFSQELRQQLAGASEKLVEAGLSKIQSS